MHPDIHVVDYFIDDGWSGKVSDAENNLAHLQRTKEELSGALTEPNDFLDHFTKYGQIEQLTRPLLTELVDENEVFEGNRIKIHFKFQNAYAQAAEIIRLNCGDDCLPLAAISGSDSDKKADVQ